jgi:HD-like signal output (HDOD) protein
MPDEIFVAGLIHDIGTLVERQAYPEEFAQVIQRCNDSEEDFLAIEREIIGADHQSFGVGLTTKWKFPRHLRAAVGFHHNPDSLSPELRNMAVLIHIADVLCCQEKLGMYLTAARETITEDHMNILSISQAALEEIRAELPQKLAEAESTLAG